MLDTEKITVSSNTIRLHKLPAVFAEYGYSQKPDTSAEKKTK